MLGLQEKHFVFVGIFCFVFLTGCSFHSRKYTRGWYFGDAIENAAHEHSPSMMPRFKKATPQLCYEDSLICSHQAIIENSDNVVNKNADNDSVHSLVVPRHKMRIERMNEMDVDTLIKGDNSDKLDYPNQQEQPKSWSDLYGQASKPIYRYFVIMVVLGLILFGLLAILLNIPDLEDYLAFVFIIAPVVMLMLLWKFRRQWKYPYRHLENELNQYKKYNQGEKWYQDINEKKDFLDLAISISLSVLLGALLLSYPVIAYYLSML